MPYFALMINPYSFLYSNVLIILVTFYVVAYSSADPVTVTDYARAIVILMEVNNWCVCNYLLIILVALLDSVL